MTKSVMSLDVVEDFLKRYPREQPFYREAARICADFADDLLRAGGIRAIISHRAKRLDSLSIKLNQRDKIKNYQNIEEIYLDVVDLSGVRVALYFPNDLAKLKVIITDNFLVLKHKEFPDKASDKSRFRGYYAEHFHVRIPDAKLKDDNHIYSSHNIEIQVASVLMHAWSEVEHDLLYKPLNGKMSEDEISLLDQLNGLVHTGELSLNLLQASINRRLSIPAEQISNYYELSSVIYALIAEKPEKFYRVGDVEKLFQLIKLTGYDDTTSFRKLLDGITLDNRRVVVEQIAERVNEISGTQYETKMLVTSKFKHQKAERYNKVTLEYKWGKLNSLILEVKDKLRLSASGTKETLNAMVELGYIANEIRDTYLNVKTRQNSLLRLSSPAQTKIREALTKIAMIEREIEVFLED